MTDASASSRSVLRGVAVPSEHGGWGLTLEPAALGLLVAPSAAGACLAAAALTVFLLRTPLKIALVDRRRARRLPRTEVAERVVAVEALALALLVGAAVVTADEPFWLPAVLALPFAALELGFDVRSRSRRLLPELAGATAISSVVAMIVVAGGEGHRLAFALWLVLVGRIATSIPWVRTQIARLHGHRPRPALLAIADLAAIVVVASATAIDDAVVGGALAVLALILTQRVVATRPTPSARVLGILQLVFGILVVAATVLTVTT